MDDTLPCRPILFASGCSGQQTFLTALLELPPDAISALREPAALSDIDVSCTRSREPTRAILSGPWPAWRAFLAPSGPEPEAFLAGLSAALMACKIATVRLGFWHLPLLSQADIDAIHDSDLPKLSAARLADWLSGHQTQDRAGCLLAYRKLLQTRPACLFRHQAILGPEGWRTFESTKPAPKKQAQAKLVPA